MTTLSTLQPEEILFVDIETVSLCQYFNELDEEWQQLWLEKSKYQRERKQTSPEESYEEAGIYAEFGKIICVSAGFFISENSNTRFRVTSFFGTDEKSLLESFAQLLDQHQDKPFRMMCAHNGKEFDFPYLCRRMLVHGIALPDLLDLAGKKPWENPHLDTMEMWKFGDYKHFTSLRLLAKLFNIPTPKDDIDGSMVRSVFYDHLDLPRIERYCKKDVVTVARVLLGLKALPPLADHQIIWLDGKRLDHPKVQD
jgi:hypothetical protein